MRSKQMVAYPVHVGVQQPESQAWVPLRNENDS